MPLKQQRHRRLLTERLEPRVALAVDGLAAISGVLTQQSPFGVAPLVQEQVDLYRDTDQDGLLTSFDEFLGQTVSDSFGGYVFEFLGAGDYLVDLPNRDAPASATTISTLQAFGVRLGFLDAFSVPQETLAVDGFNQTAFDQSFDNSQAVPAEILGFERDIRLDDAAGSSGSFTQVGIDLGLLDFETSSGSSSLELVYDGIDDVAQLDESGLADFTGDFANAAGLRFGALGQGGQEFLDIVFSIPGQFSNSRTVEIPQMLSATGLRSVVVPFAAEEPGQSPIDFSQVGAVTIQLAPSEPGYELTMSEIEIVGFANQQVDFSLSAVSIDLSVEFVLLPVTVSPGQSEFINVRAISSSSQAVDDAVVLLEVFDAGGQLISSQIEQVPALAAQGSEDIAFQITPPTVLNSPLTVVASISTSAGEPDLSNNHVEAELNAAPTSTLSGKVYVDANGNGVYDDGEAGIPGVRITLTATAFFDEPINRVVLTDASGDYSFANLPRGVIYLIQEEQPQQYRDGSESLGIPSSVAVPPDSIYVHVVRSTGDASGFNFGELIAFNGPESVIEAPPQEIVPPPPPPPPVIDTDRFLQRGFFTFTPAPRPPQPLGGASSVVEPSASLGSAMGAVSPVLTERAADDLDLDLLLDNLLDFMAPDALPVDLGDAPPSAEEEAQESQDTAPRRSRASLTLPQRPDASEQSSTEQPASEPPAEDPEDSAVAVLALAGVAIGLAHSEGRQRKLSGREERRP